MLGTMIYLNRNHSSDANVMRCGDEIVDPSPKLVCHASGFLPVIQCKFERMWKNGWTQCLVQHFTLLIKYYFSSRSLYIFGVALAFFRKVSILENRENCYFNFPLRFLLFQLQIKRQLNLYL